MLDGLNSWVLVGAALCAALVFGMYQHETIDKLNMQIQLNKAEIANIKVDSDKNKANAEAVQKAASLEMQELNAKASKISLEKISPKCEDAFQWMVTKAKALNT